MSAPGTIDIVIAVLALLWLALAAAIAIVAARRLRIAQQVIDVARANARLLDVMPARPLLVRPDRRIDVDGQLLRDLRLDKSPSALSDLARGEAGLDADDLAALEQEVETARASAGHLSSGKP